MIRITKSFTPARRKAALRLNAAEKTMRKLEALRRKAYLEEKRAAAAYQAEAKKAGSNIAYDTCY